MKNVLSKRLGKNLAWLKQNAAYLCQKAMAWEEDQTEVVIQQTSIGWNAQISIAQGSSFFLHSLFDREREYRQITATIEANHATVVLFGCASGEFLQWLSSNYSQIKHLIIVEPSVKVFRLFMQQWYLPDILSNFPKVSLIVGEKQADVGDWLKKAVNAGTLEEKFVVVISLVNYQWHYSDYAKEIHKELVEMLRFTKVNRNTLAVHRDLWLVNLWHNLQYCNADASDFQECFKGLPAIIVSAGPSLDKNIHLLREAKDKALIVAVGSAISVLHKKQIRPHLRVAIDPSPLNEKIFAGTYEDGVPLVYSNKLFFNILKKYQGRNIHALLAAGADIEAVLLKKAEVPCWPISSGFSVANIAANLLAKWKCNPIVFMGQDLAYTEDRLHASGSWDNDFEKQHMRKMHIFKDIYGNDVYSDPAFDGMRQIFEGIISRNPDIQFLNATEGGIPIDGAPNHKLEELLAMWPDNRDFEAVIANLVTKLEDSGILEERQKKLYEAAISLKAGVEEYIEQIKKIKRQIEELLNKDRLTDKEARNAVRRIKEFKQHEMYSLVISAFKEAFAMRREGYLKDNEEKVLPQVRIFYLELNDILAYLGKMLQLIIWYEAGEEFKIIFD